MSTRNGQVHGSEPEAAPGAKPEAVPEPKRRWSRAKKRDVVLRLLRGESLDGVSRELGVEVYRLEAWRDRALAGMEDAMRERGEDSNNAELEAAMKRIGELSMENELLREKCRQNGPFGLRRSRR